MKTDLRDLFQTEPRHTDDLDSFISERLFLGNVWSSRRQSDGIRDVRVVRSDADRLSIGGRVFEIDQTLRAFWLDLARASTATVRWALYFDIEEPSGRRGRNAIDVVDSPDDVQWRVSIRGTGAILDGRLVVHE